MYNIAVLTSGLSRGSNLKAIIDYISNYQIPVKISFVIITKADAPVKTICNDRNITCCLVEYSNSKQFEEEVLNLSRYHGIQLLVLAGFLKILSAKFLEDISIPVINIHPALLPKYGGKGMYGMAVHKKVFESKEAESGVTIHFVDPVYDHGQIITQKKIAISQCKSPEEIADLVLKLEHELYGPTIWNILKNQ